jgi:hypothetical protein
MTLQLSPLRNRRITEEATPLRIGQVGHEGSRWEGQVQVLAINLTWARVKAVYHDGWLWIEPLRNKRQASGSLILAGDGTAIGVLVSGGEMAGSEGVRNLARSEPHPVLIHHLPEWLLRGCAQPSRRQGAILTFPNRRSDRGDEAGS